MSNIAIRGVQMRIGLQITEQDRPLVDVKAGDVLALMSAGAYGFTMASNYNSRPLPAEILVSGNDAKIVRRRQTYADLISLETSG